LTVFSATEIDFRMSIHQSLFGLAAISMAGIIAFPFSAAGDASRPNFALYRLDEKGRPSHAVADQCEFSKKTIKCRFFDTGSSRGFHEKWEGEQGELQPNSGAKWRVRDKNMVEEPEAPPKFISAPDTDRIQAPGFNLDDRDASDRRRHPKFR
jgi:hypothetical protein